MRVFHWSLMSLLVSFVFPADAQIVTLAPGIEAISPLTGELVSVSSLCPPGTMCLTDGTVLTLKFELKGCHDRLGPVSYETVKRDEQLEVYVSALNLHSKHSQSLKQTSCPKKKAKTYPITLIGEFFTKDKIKVAFLNSSP